MGEIKSFFFSVCFFVFMFFWALGTITILGSVCGCSTTSGGKYQRAVTAVEAERGVYQRAVEDGIRGLDTAVERLESISRRSEDVGGEIDDIILLFDEYNEGVRELIRAYKNLTMGTDTSIDSKRSATGS